MVGSTNQLYAFFYEPGKVEKKINAWGIYQPVKEFERMGLGTKTNEWRITHINKDYQVCEAWKRALMVSYVLHILLSWRFQRKSRITFWATQQSLDQSVDYLHSLIFTL
jgi:hypothetical protein